MTNTDETISFGSLKLTFNAKDLGGQAYKQSNWFEEFTNPLAHDIQRVLDPKWVFDIGANYGLTVLFASRRFPGARIVAVEPAADVAAYLRRNAADNNVQNLQVFEGFLGEYIDDQATFHVRPSGSQDARVKPAGAGWVAAPSRQTTLDLMAEDVRETEGVYIKIDTQGFEAQVFRGAEGFLGRHPSWLIKTEFAPDWLRSQGSDPLWLLHYLLDRYVVAEVPARSTFGTATIAEIMKRPLTPDALPAFLDHVENLNRNGRGWVDLMILPKALHASLPKLADRPTEDLRSDIEGLKAEIASLKSWSLSVDVANVLALSRNLFMNVPTPLTDQPDLSVLRGSHGHGLFMLLLSDRAARQPGSLAGRTIVEVGTTRERMPGQGSTEKLAFFCALTDMDFVTVDMDEDNTKRAMGVLPFLYGRATAVTERGEDYFASRPGPFHFVYLDAYDFDHGKHSDHRQARYLANLGEEINDPACWEMHLQCARHLAPKMAAGGIVVFDDTVELPEGGYKWKGKLAVPYLLENGFRIIGKTRTAIGLVKEG